MTLHRGLRPEGCRGVGDELRARVWNWDEVQINLKRKEKLVWTFEELFDPNHP